MAKVFLKVHGRVQGVFFRQFVRKEAERLGISATAENLADGSVEIVAEGDKEALEKLVAWCKKGPQLARVDNIEID